MATNFENKWQLAALKKAYYTILKVGYFFIINLIVCSNTSLSVGVNAGTPPPAIPSTEEQQVISSDVVLLMRSY